MKKILWGLGILCMSVNSVWGVALTSEQIEFAHDLGAHPDRLGFLTPGKSIAYMFIAEDDGTVDIYTTGKQDTVGYLYSNNLYVPDIMEDDISYPDNNNFSFSNIKVEKDMAYFILVTAYDDSAHGNFGMHLRTHYVPEEDTTPDSDSRWNTGKWFNNESRSRILKVPQADDLVVKINGKVEEAYDKLIIKDSQGAFIREFTGHIDEEFAVTGSQIYVELLSDDTVESEGVIITVEKYDYSRYVPYYFGNSVY